MDELPLEPPYDQVPVGGLVYVEAYDATYVRLEKSLEHFDEGDVTGVCYPNWRADTRVEVREECTRDHNPNPSFRPRY